jgi:hypothetical protein
MRLLQLIILSFLCLTTSAQRIRPEKIVALPDQLGEVSGIAFLGTKLLAINDSGNEPKLFEISTDGKIIKIWSHPDLKNIDWEEITRDDKGNYYVADIGNNMQARKDLTIYKITFQKEQISFSKINFRYSEQVSFPPAKEFFNYDAEAIVWVNDSISLFTKNNTIPYTGFTRVYRIPDKPGTYTLSAADSICLGKEGYYHHTVTSASYNFINKQLALLTYNHIFIFQDFKGRNLSASYFSDFIFEGFSQKESIAFDEKNNLFVADEKSAGFIGGKLGWYNIRNHLNGSTPYTSNTIERIHMKTKSKGKSLLQYFITETGEYELVCFTDDEKIVKHYYLPVGKKLNETKVFELDFDFKMSAKWILRVYRNKKMIYCNKVSKMFYD